MKKTAILDRIHDKPESHISKSNLPKLTYNQALDLVVTLSGGAIRTIRSLHTSEMKDLVESCAATAKSPKACADAVAGLDYNEMIDRWFAVLELHLHGVMLPIAAAEEVSRS